MTFLIVLLLDISSCILVGVVSWWFGYHYGRINND